MRHKKTKMIILSVFISFLLHGETGGFSKSTLKYAVGFGISEGGINSSGLGRLLSVGYQHNLSKDRIRINPNFTSGFFRAASGIELPDQCFNSYTLDALVYWDFLRYKSVSLTIGAGAFLNNTIGLVGTSENGIYYSNSDFFDLWHTGGCVGAGMRFNPAKSRIAIELMPFNLRFGFNKYFDLHAKVSVEVKLRKMY